MKRIKEQKGAITLVVLISSLFLLTFLISTYVILSNRAKTELEIMNETLGVYDNGNQVNEIYYGLITQNGEVIPIYDVKDLLTAATNTTAFIEEENKYFNFSDTASYILMNDLEFDVDDWESMLGVDRDWIPFFYTNLTGYQGTMIWNNHKIRVIHFGFSTIATYCGPDNASNNPEEFPNNDVIYNFSYANEEYLNTAGIVGFSRRIQECAERGQYIETIISAEEIIMDNKLCKVRYIERIIFYT